MVGYQQSPYHLLEQAARTGTMGRDLPRPLGPLLQLEKRVGRCLWEAALVPKTPGRRWLSSLKAEQGDEVTKDLAASLARHLQSSDHVEVVE